jgi:choline dehydrogenase-like flavoprotein
MAKELSTRGHSVVVLEQGPRLDPNQFEHDEFKYTFNNGITNPRRPPGARWRRKRPRWGQGLLLYARLVGGSSVHFTANFWRLHEIDFVERSRLGGIPGADSPGLADHLCRPRAVLHQSGLGGRRLGNARTVRSRPGPGPIRCRRCR